MKKYKKQNLIEILYSIIFFGILVAICWSLAAFFGIYDRWGVWGVIATIIAVVVVIVFIINVTGFA